MRKNIFKARQLRTAGFLFPFCLFTCLTFLTSCSSVLDTDSELVEFEKDNTLNHPTDSVYSVMGIIGKMQQIADRTVLLGEVRADLVKTTNAASSDLKRLASFDLAEDNKYCRVSDYYAVINNCNYFLAHADTAMERRGRKLFAYEYAAVKAFRAWTYLQLAVNYGSVPLVTKPLMTEKEAEEAMNGPRLGITDICNYFISDLTPYARVHIPAYGNIGNHDSEYFFIPMRALLGDLCLWAGRYREAATWYHDYLGDRDNPILPSYYNRVRWSSTTEYLRPMTSYSVTSSDEYLTYIPMEERVVDGTVSDLPNIFGGTSQNKYYNQLVPSQGMRNISAAQIYCQEYKTETETDTVYAPRTGLLDDIYVGDLRLSSNFHEYSLGGQDEFSEYNSVYQTIYKTSSTRVTYYRCTMVWLRYAEALCRAGLPQSAFCILKYGMCKENNEMYVDSLERKDAAGLTDFNETYFTRQDTKGIHSIGSGDSECNIYYTLPQPATTLATRQDTIDWQIPLVEDAIINEMALEGAFEGYRFYDLMRVALRRNDPAYLADPVSRRNGESDATLRTLLMDQKNWYLPLR